MQTITITRLLHPEPEIIDDFPNMAEVVVDTAVHPVTAMYYFTIRIVNSRNFTDFFRKFRMRREVTQGEEIYWI